MPKEVAHGGNTPFERFGMGASYHAWIHVYGCCLNQPKVMQLQFYADFSHFMLVTCAAPATWHQHFPSLPKLP